MSDVMTSEFAGAFSKFQSELHGAVKNATNPHYKSGFANLESVWESIRIPLTKHGFSVIQTTEYKDGVTCLITTLLHSSGGYIRGAYPLAPTKSDPQGIGSAMTYARRYALAAIVGQIQIDDDAESAMNRDEEPPQAPLIPKTPENGNKTPSYSQKPPIVGVPVTGPQVNRLYRIALDSGWTSVQVTRQVEDVYKRAPEALFRSEYDDVVYFFQNKKPEFDFGDLP